VGVMVVVVIATTANATDYGELTIKNEGKVLARKLSSLPPSL